eukprot:9503974-Pyramimonas_sp.AAC.2
MSGGHFWQLVCLGVAHIPGPFRRRPLSHTTSAARSAAARNAPSASPSTSRACQGSTFYTVKRTVKTLLGHLVTGKFNSPANSLRTTPCVRVDPQRLPRPTAMPEGAHYCNRLPLRALDGLGVFQCTSVPS